MMTREQTIETAERLRALPLQEFEALEIPRVPSEEEVRADVVAWKARIEALFADIETWVAEHGKYATDRDECTEMFEPYMAYHHLPEEILPVLRIKNGDDILMRFIPDALWVALTNGRVAVKTKRLKPPPTPEKEWLWGLRLLHTSRPPDAAPDWRLSSTGRHRTDEPFSKQALLQALGKLDDALG